MKKNNKGLSIIIPCYNVENYIINCLDSLSKQLVGFDYEIILVNDFSTDNTSKIIKKYISNSKLNIAFLENEKNCGAGYSRNLAISKAKYDYISFIDADDYVDDNFYEELFNKIIDDDGDVVLCDINLIYEDGSPDYLFITCDGIVNKFNVINNGLAASPCNKIIKKQLLLEYPFAEGIMNEDIASILSILANCKKILYSSKTKYNYIQHSSSMQNKKFSIKRFDVFKAVDIFKERIKENKDYSKLVSAVAYQQLFLFFLYVMPKEKNIFKRRKYLKMFTIKAKEYDLLNNEYCINHLVLNGRKVKFYYSILLKLMNKHLFFTASLFVSIFNVYHNVKHSSLFNKSVIKKDIAMDDIVTVAKRQFKMKKAKKSISVVVPNYNYENFLLQRIYSILNQNYKIGELIILDDCSKDNSRELIDNICKEISSYIDIKKVYNETNSGTAFKQWEKGFSYAKCDYVWIAEADDYCDKKLLTNIMNPIENDSDIVISYVDTAFIDKDGFITLKTIKPEIDIQKSGHWDNNFINDGKEEIKKYAFLNCTIANVSSCVFKNNNYGCYFKESGEYRQAGDWLFYVNVMKNGKISFINKPLNYYRVHGNNVTSLTKKEKHLGEIKLIHDRIKKEFSLNTTHEKKMKERIEFLEKVWNLK